MRMLGMLLGGAASLALSVATAYADGQVKWKDDGTVVLQMGPEYDNRVITVPQRTSAPSSARTRSPSRA